MRSRYCTIEADYRQTQSRGLSAVVELLVEIWPWNGQLQMTDRRTDDGPTLTSIAYLLLKAGQHKQKKFNYCWDRQELR